MINLCLGIGKGTNSIMKVGADNDSAYVIIEVTNCTIFNYYIYVPANGTSLLCNFISGTIYSIQTNYAKVLISI